ncbi:Y1101-like protein [Mya arenaria]|uniref:Y1101-like protein n=1 Tax=Mya arenaria TaxID=6604 RepID=A0ABY7FXE2_MYAAR|nr:Y1101-like protein [Mya arenaria]
MSGDHHTSGERHGKQAVVLALDGSEHADYAFEWYMEHLHKSHHYVVLLHVPERHAFMIGGKVKSVAGKPGEVIVSVADEEHALFVICGSRGKGTFRRTFLGSISDYVLHHSHIPVFICKHKDLHKDLVPPGSGSPSLKHRLLNSPLFRRKNKDSPKNSPKLDRKKTDSESTE